MHSASATLPQLFHTRRALTFALRATVLALGLVAGSAVSLGQTPEVGSTYRVFLRNGDALPSYGEAAVANDRLVFNLSIGGVDGPLTLQLMSLPLALVDLDRTSRYAESMRAAFYAATRGEAEYSALTSSLSHDLDALSQVQDRKRQLLLAEEIRQRLIIWPRTHFHYRADDVEKLLGLVGDVIDELKAAVGEKAVEFELTAGPVSPVREAILPVPRRREAIQLSVAASSVADDGDDRVAILRAASSITPPTDPELSALVQARLKQEVHATQQYAALASDIRKRVRAAIDTGDPRTVERLETELLGRDQQLGFRRPQVVQSLVEEVRAARATAAARRETLDKYAAVRRRLLGYELEVRAAFSAVDGLRSLLQYVRDTRPVSFERIVGAQDRFERMRVQIEAVRPPAEAGNIHATLVSAMRMAVEACVRRREAAVTNALPASRAASAAAAGALLLADRARADLVDSLCLGGRVTTCGP